MKTSYILIGVALLVVLYLTMSKTTLKTQSGTGSSTAGILTAGAKVITAGTAAYTAISDSSTGDN
jgi:hypothetical protein